MTDPVPSADDLAAQVDEAARYIAARWDAAPRMGIVLGTGQGGLVGAIDVEAALPYEAIPGFARSTAVGHRGRLVCGRLQSVPVVVMDGRLHRYEGYAAWRITFPIRVMHALGVRLLVITNAAGGVNPNYYVGDVVAVEDHIDLMHTNLSLGLTDDRLGDRSPHRGRLYDREFIDLAQAIARRENFACHRGVYVGLTGPNYETRAEYRFVRHIGGDVVGMSTVPEAIVAHRLGLRVLALSTVTNVCRPDALAKTTGDDVVAAAATAELKLRAILLGFASNQVLVEE